MSEEDEDIIDQLDEEDTTDSPSGASDTEFPGPFGESDDGHRVGHITAQDEPISIGREESLVQSFVDTDERDEVRLGDYLRIPYPAGEEMVREMMVGVIHRLVYETSADITDKQDGGYQYTPGEQSFSYVGQLNPIGTVELPEDGDTLQQGTVDRPPKPGSDVFLVENPEFLRTALRIPHDGVFVGNMAVSGDPIPSEESPLPYFLSNPNATDGTEDEGEPAIFRHALVAGSTGQGKTHASKNILRQYASGKQYTVDVPPEEKEASNADLPDERVRGMNLIVVDPEDEYVEMGEDPQVPSYDSDYREWLDDQGVRHGGINNDPDVNFEVFVPQVGGTTITVDNARTFGIPFEIVEGNHSLLYRDSPPERTAGILNQMIPSYFNQHPNPTYNDFSHWMEENVELFTDNDNIQTAVTERVCFRNELSRVFDHGTDMLTDLTQQVFAPNQVTVIPTGHLRGDVDKLAVSCLLSHIMENKVNNDVTYPHIKGTPMVLALDEAHEYISDTSDPREGYLIHKYQQAAKRGRKYKFGLYNITQNPQDIDDEIRSQTNTRIYLGLERDVVDSHNVYVPEEFKEAVTQFNQGQMVVKQPNVRPVEVKGLSVCLTRHSN